MIFKRKIVERLEIRIQELEKDILELMKEKDNLEDNNVVLRRKFDNLKFKTDKQEEELSHKITMREERNQLALDKKEQKIRDECAETVREVKEACQKVIEQHLKDRYTEVIEMYKEILERLPNVNMKINRKE